ncbi:MAG: sodium:solute symporter family protein [Rickettsiales bacterium TMED254]|nr:sodium:solute symporter [Rickettsiales bacterium]RPF77319.1 MAG: sodium:solute symporter family protein [Rickettsiales bacterium TMED254]
MEKWHIALVAISIYLTLAFLIGVMAGKGKSFFSLSEYAVGDRSFNFFVMWFLMGGTIFSAFAFLGGPGWAYSKGAASFYILVYCTLGLMPWYVIGPKVSKIGKKNNYITMGDFLGDRYQSKILTVIVGIVAILAFIPYLTLQIKGMAYIFNVLTYGNIPYWLGAFISFGIVVIYVATSGVRGAAWSDVFQAILMLIIAWVLGIYFVEKLHGGIGNMFESITSSNSSFLIIGEEGSAMTKARYSSNIIISMIGFVMWPHLFTKSYTTTEKRIKTTVAVYPIFALFLLPVLFIGFSGYGIVGKDEIDSSGQILPYLITNFLTESGILYGIVGAGALAAAMSSSDAITHGASVSFGRDICKAIYSKIPENIELWIMRAAVFIIGGVSYLLAIFGSEGLIQLLLGAYGPIAQLAPSVYCALFFKKVNSKAVILGLVVGVIITIYYQYFASSTLYDLHAGLIGIIGNLTCVILFSMVFERGITEKIKSEEFSKI